ncbi:MAG: hypothetical protein F4Y57_08980 [Acidobacteria bacterium]|nr:hypothetical protein [Acidobacteriota bacterium]
MASSAPPRRGPRGTRPRPPQRRRPPRRSPPARASRPAARPRGRYAPPRLSWLPSEPSSWCPLSVVAGILAGPLLGGHVDHFARDGLGRRAQTDRHGPAHVVGADLAQALAFHLAVRGNQALDLGRLRAAPPMRRIGAQGNCAHHQNVNDRRVHDGRARPDKLHLTRRHADCHRLRFRRRPLLLRHAC